MSSTACSEWCQIYLYDFIFILSCSYLDIVIILNFQCLCGHCNGVICATTNIWKNKSPSESYNMNLFKLTNLWVNSKESSIDFISFFIFFSENMKSCSANDGSKSCFLFDWSFPRRNPLNAIWKVVKGLGDYDVNQWRVNPELLWLLRCCNWCDCNRV